MKHLLTAIACFFALSMSAQTWNPDADFDNVIGVNDLMELLTVFGTEWTAEYPQDPEYELAAYYVGESKLGDCIASCANNNGRIASTWEFALFRDSALTAAGFEEIIDNPCAGCGCTSGQSEHAHFYIRTSNWYGTWNHNQQVDCGDTFMNSTFTSHPSNGAPSSAANYHCICTGFVPTVE